jgi:hypothetical protein
MHLQRFSAMLAYEKNNKLRREQAMNGILIKPAGIELDSSYATADTGTLEDTYATTPMRVVQSIYQQPDEEELHTSFEEAISDRVLAVNRQLSRLSGTHAGNLYVQSQTSAPVKRDGLAVGTTLLARAWQRGMLFAALAFMFVLVGFDLMGLLVLHLR